MLLSEFAQLRADVLAQAAAAAAAHESLDGVLAQVAGAVRAVGARVDEGFKDVKVDLKALGKSLTGHLEALSAHVANGNLATLASIVPQEPGRLHP